MSGRNRWVLGFLMMVVGSGALASLSRAPWTPPDATRATLRLSWRATSRRIEECRPMTESERARLPAHMRQERVCEGRVAPYRLRVRIDGTVVSNDTVRAAGARSDRPIYVLREYAVAAGVREVRVEFDRTEPSGAATVPDNEERPGNSFPASLDLQASVRAIPGRTTLITYDADARALVLRTSSR